MEETQEMRVPSLGQEDPLEKETATHSSILAWKIPWTQEFDGLQSTGHDWAHTHKLQVEMVKEYDQVFNSVFCFTLFYSRNTAPPSFCCYILTALCLLY